MINYSQIHSYSVLSLTILLFLLVAGKGIKSKIQGIDFKGSTPIGKSLFLIGKASSFGNWFFYFYRAISINESSYYAVNLVFSWIGAALLFIAVLLVYSSFLYLGKANRLGLPEEETFLRTDGIYKISRNPMYLGFAIISTGSVLYYPNPLNIIFAILSILIHHKIILSEENFLSGRFNIRWEEYKKRIPRYLIYI